jgi:hypothetical protein
MVLVAALRAATACADTTFTGVDLDFNLSTGANPQLIDWTVTFTNGGAQDSGATALEVWVFPSPWTCEDDLSRGHKVAQILNIGTLRPGARQSHSGIGSLVAWDPPAPGNYYSAIVLSEQVAGYALNNGYKPRHCVYYVNPQFWAGVLLPEAGLWWNPAESGTGYTLVVRSGTLVLQMYSYRSDGEPQWYLTAGPTSNGNRNYAGTLDKYRGGQCATCTTYRAPQAQGNDGAIGIVFHSSVRATVTLPGGRVTSIVPFAF